MKVIVVDDELDACEDLQYRLSKIPSITQIKDFANPLEAFEFVKGNPVDVAFLDIEMYEMTGIEMAAQDYLLKPATAERYV